MHFFCFGNVLFTEMIFWYKLVAVWAIGMSISISPLPVCIGANSWSCVFVTKTPKYTAKYEECEWYAQKDDGCTKNNKLSNYMKLLINFFSVKNYLHTDCKSVVFRRVCFRYAVCFETKVEKVKCAHRTILMFICQS